MNGVIVAQCNNLQAPLGELQKNFALLMNKGKQQNLKLIEYQTDEEDLARETVYSTAERGNKTR